MTFIQPYLDDDIYVDIYQSPIFPADGFDFDYSNPTTPYVSSVSPTDGSPDQLFLPSIPSRHFQSSTYPSQQPRYISGGNHFQATRNHNSGSMFNQSRSSHSMSSNNNNNNNNNSYEIPARHSMPSHDYTDPWNAMISSSSPQDDYLTIPRQPPGLSRSPTESTVTSDSRLTHTHTQARSTGHSRHSKLKDDSVISSTQSHSSSPPVGTTQRMYCPHPSCRDPVTGQPQRSFSRKADVSRHFKSSHEPTYLDCPWSRCDRQGPNGFTRSDHLMEHRRGYHGESLQKRGSGVERRESRSSSPRHARK